MGSSGEASPAGIPRATDFDEHVEAGSPGDSQTLVMRDDSRRRRTCRRLLARHCLRRQ